MRQFYCAEDIERIVAEGQKHLVVGEGVALTDLARETAQRLGLTLVTSVVAAPPKGGRPAAAATSGRPKGCQHGPLPEAPPDVARGGSSDDPVVDELVGLVRQLRNRD